MKKFHVKLRASEIYEMDFEAENSKAAEELAIEEYNVGNCKRDHQDHSETIISIDSCVEDA